MRKGILAILAVVVLATGCTSTRPPPITQAIGPSASMTQATPYDAIQRAAAAAPDAAPGPFVLTIRAAGRQGGLTYLNSELDYRDQRNLTVAIPANVERALRQRLGGASDAALIGKTIVVHGEARRIKIRFNCRGVPTESYYYQTHVTLADAQQLEVVIGV